MRYNFKRLGGREWIKLIKSLRARGLTFLEVSSDELYDPEKVGNVFNVYYYRTTSNCKIIYYEMDEYGLNKRLREISFSDKEIDAVECVLTFKKIASKNNELIGYEPNKIYENGVYNFFSKPYEGYSTALDMNSAYLYALSQPLADYETREEVSFKEVYNKSYDFYSFENSLHCYMFYKEQQLEMQAAMLWADVKVYGYKGKQFFPKTTAELYELKKKNKEKYKNVANIAVGCMHKHSGKQNNTTIAASLYAWFEWYISELVVKFLKKGYNVIMITTDSVKIAGKYNEEDKLLTIGDGLGEFKVEFEGNSKFYSSGHYEDERVKWKGKPQYMIDGFKKCSFIDDLEEEKGVLIKYAKNESKVRTRGKKVSKSKKFNEKTIKNKK